MRLVHTRTLELEEFGENQVPQYAILSHTWDKEEILLQDFKAGNGKDLSGFKKIKNACSTAAKDGFEYIWIDTCCIDKTSSAELSESLNSMYRWYENAEECYAFLADVSPGAVDYQDLFEGDEFRNSKWFRRGWTLQELLAPPTVIFLDNDWQHIGSKSNLQQVISEITGIPGSFLFGDDLENASVAQRMSWAAKRETTRIEDRAYSLMGIFGIFMPMLYGEGERAFIRLQEEIMKTSEDHSLFAWRSNHDHGGILATSPSAFVDSGDIVQISPFILVSNPLTTSSRGVRLTARLLEKDQHGLGLAILECTLQGMARMESMRLAIYIRDVSLKNQDFVREQSTKLELVHLNQSLLLLSPTDLYIRQWRSIRSKKLEDIEKCAVKFHGAGEEIGSLISHLHSDWEHHEGLIMTTSFGLADGILGRIVIMCRNGSSAQLVLRKYEKFLWAEIYENFRDFSETHQVPITPEQYQHQQNQSTTVLLDGHHIYLAIKKRVLLIHEQKHLVDVVEISYANKTVFPGSWLDRIAILDEESMGRSELLYAAERGYENLVKLLLDTKKFNVDSRDGEQPKPVSTAATDRMLLRNSISFVSENENEDTPLLCAAREGHTAVVMQLLQKGAQIESEDKDGCTPLLCAAREGHIAVVMQLLEKGAQTETEDNDRYTPLSHAVRGGYVAVAMLLLRGVSKIETQDKFLDIPLSYAINEFSQAVVSLLLQNGGDIDLEDKRDDTADTPLVEAIISRSEAMVSLLLQNSADIEPNDEEERTPLSQAIKIGSKAIVDLLPKHCENIQSKTRPGETPLSKVGKSAAILKLLLEKGARMEATDKSDLTPLQQAAKIDGADEGINEILLDKDPEIDSKDINGLAPSSYAVDSVNDGAVTAVDVLIDNGAEVRLADRSERRRWNRLRGTKMWLDSLKRGLL